MDFKLSKEQQMLQKLFREFAENEVKPIAADVDKEEQFPEETVKKMAKLGMMGIYLPKQYGGAGAIQHLAGMQDSECIISVNKNGSAPIFDASTYGITGDLFKVGPMLAEAIKSFKAAKG